MTTQEARELLMKQACEYLDQFLAILIVVATDKDDALHGLECMSEDLRGSINRFYDMGKQPESSDSLH